MDESKRKEIRAQIEKLKQEVKETRDTINLMREIVDPNDQDAQMNLVIQESEVTDKEDEVMRLESQLGGQVEEVGSSEETKVDFAQKIGRMQKELDQLRK